MEIVNQIVYGEALNVLREIPDNSFDACITDPPFGIGFSYNGKVEENDEHIKYGEWIKKHYKEIERVVKPGGFVAVFQSGKYFKYLWEWFGDDIYIYGACKNFLQIRSTMPINFGFDPVAVKYLKGEPPRRPLKPRRNMNFYVACTSKELLKTYNIEKEHPCPRPLTQILELVSNFVKEDGVVLDCFMGSGTTAIACLKRNRKYFGIENKKAFFELIQKRIKEHKNNVIRVNKLMGNKTKTLF